MTAEALSRPPPQTQEEGEAPESTSELAPPQDDDDRLWTSFLPLYDACAEDDDNARHRATTTPDESSSTTYPSSKPQWWRRIAGRRGTKAQRAAVARLSASGHVLPKIPYDARLDPACSCVLDDVDTSSAERRRWPEVWLELGFGNGANLLANARRRPDLLYVGAELYQPGVGNLCLRLEEGRKEQEEERRLTLDTNSTNNALTTTTSPPIYSNVRIHPGDGTKLLRSLATSSLTAVSVTFPDPFCNEHQEKWRILQRDTIHELRRVLTKQQQGGGRFLLATDVEEYDAWTRKSFQAERGWRELTDGMPDREEWLPVVSVYEAKGLREGRRTWLQCWEVVS